jgi:hypothetical protein
MPFHEKIDETKTDWKHGKDKDIDTTTDVSMPRYFSSPSNSERKDANTPSSVSVL